MTKRELINYLYAYSNAENSVMQHERNVDRLRSEIRRRKATPILQEFSMDDFKEEGIYPTVAIAGSFSLIFLLALPNMFFLLAPASFALVYACWCTQRKEKYENEYRIAMENYEKGLTEIPDLEKQLQSNLPLLRTAQQNRDRLKQQNILPYAYSHCSRTLVRYLETGRADTLKEAINLYELELRQDEIYEENRRHNQEMERQQHRQNQLAADALAEASRAADASEEAARNADFWGAVTAYQLDEIARKK